MLRIAMAREHYLVIHAWKMLGLGIDQMGTLKAANAEGLLRRQCTFSSWVEETSVWERVLFTNCGKEGVAFLNCPSTYRVAAPPLELRFSLA